MLRGSVPPAPGLGRQPVEGAGASAARAAGVGPAQHLLLDHPDGEQPRGGPPRAIAAGQRVLVALPGARDVARPRARRSAPRTSVRPSSATVSVRASGRRRVRREPASTSGYDLGSGGRQGHGHVSACAGSTAGRGTAGRRGRRGRRRRRIAYPAHPRPRHTADLGRAGRPRRHRRRRPDRARRTAVGLGPARRAGGYLRPGGPPRRRGCRATKGSSGSGRQAGSGTGSGSPSSGAGDAPPAGRAAHRVRPLPAPRRAAPRPAAPTKPNPVGDALDQTQQDLATCSSR